MNNYGYKEDSSMKKWLLTIVFGSALVLGACGSDDDADKGKDGGGDSTDTAQAEDLYKENCASCHANDLSGNNGPSLEKVGADLSEDEIHDTIKDGKGGGMPSFDGQIDDDDISTLASWLADHK